MKVPVVRKECTVVCKSEPRLCADEACELMLFLRGDVLVRVNGRDYVPEPGDLLLFAGGEPHTVTAGPGQPFERVSVYFDGDVLRQLFGGEYDLLMSFNLEGGGAKSNLIRARFVSLYGLGEKLKAMYGLFRTQAPEAPVLLISRLLSVLADVNDAHRQQLSHVAGPGDLEGGEKIHGILRYIVDNLSEPFTLDGLAARFYISKYYLCHEFKRVVGVPCLEYIRQKRIEKARELLLGGWPASDVWPELGFSDYMSFYRSFKKVTGLSPNEYVSAKRSHSASGEFAPRERGAL